jgi:hypothetical protein
MVEQFLCCLLHELQIAMLVFQYPKYNRIIAKISGEDRKYECNDKYLGCCAHVELMTGDSGIKNSVSCVMYVNFIWYCQDRGGHFQPLCNCISVQYNLGIFQSSCITCFIYLKYVRAFREAPNHISYQELFIS